MPKKQSLNLLFIGNSHTYYNDMPLLVKRRAEDEGYSCRVTMPASILPIPGVQHAIVPSLKAAVSSASTWSLCCLPQSRNKPMRWKTRRKTGNDKPKKSGRPNVRRYGKMSCP